jgi:hypothetical protein
LGVVLSLIGSILPMIPGLEGALNMLSAYLGLAFGWFFYLLYLPVNMAMNGYEKSMEKMPKLALYQSLSRGNPF